MKYFGAAISIVFLLISCEKEMQKSSPFDDKSSNISETSIYNKLELIQSISLDEGPHELFIADDILFAVRDQQLTMLDLINPALPKMIGKKIFSTAQRLGKPFYQDAKIWIPSQTENCIYILSKPYTNYEKLVLNLNSFQPNVIYSNHSGDIFIGGSNGSKGIIAKYQWKSDALSLEQSWTAPTHQSMIESFIEKDGYLLASMSNGEVVVFDMDNLSAGPVMTLSYESEPGYEKWGYSLVRVGDQAFFANWGAGVATLDITHPTTTKIKTVLSNSVFKSQFPAAEGVNAYDIVYNTKNNLLLVANGWSGVFMIDPAQPDQVLDYIDPQYFQNRSIATLDDYVYTGNISGGMSGDLKGVKVFKIKK